MKYFYKLVQNGKLIALYAHNNKVNNPDYIELTEEEYNAELTAIREHAEAVNQYTEQVKNGEIQLVEVPEDCREDVERDIDQLAIADYTQQVIDGTVSLTAVPDKYLAQVTENIENNPEVKEIADLLQEVNKIGY